MGTALLREEENLCNRLVDDSRRDLVFLRVEREDKAPLLGSILLLLGGAIGLALILLFKQSSGFTVLDSNEILHLHD